MSELKGENERQALVSIAKTLKKNEPCETLQDVIDRDG